MSGCSVSLSWKTAYNSSFSNEPRHEIFNNVVCAMSRDSDQPAHTRSLIRAFASFLDIYQYLATDQTAF